MGIIFFLKKVRGCEIKTECQSHIWFNYEMNTCRLMAWFLIDSVSNSIITIELVQISSNASFLNFLVIKGTFCFVIFSFLYWRHKYHEGLRRSVTRLTDDN